ncbi:MFS transporter [Flavivirga aquimarina]|uniref:MFS transporter n=1 Tax=Flavivirga aquimarina TaxID=2027862 RepID=A0ABT8WBC4_9FLAO|nr:MFS transporter [Flavivirga aquimarina]MDO5970444.1 MFS transporter [Flavivirga aquimarina]
MQQQSAILKVIVVSQFLCTSLWFASNGIINDLIDTFQLKADALGHLTSSVQFGFISGTLIFAILNIADRYKPSKVFFISAILSALFNIGVLWEGNHLISLLLFRFFTGFFLAGIYPIGMKIAADYYSEGLGKSLGFLVGALVLGTALPHLLKGIMETLFWKSVIFTTTSLSITGGLLMFIMVPDGPYRKPSQKLNLLAFFSVFRNRKFRSSAFGYFGHMWELYAFWAFTPIMLKGYSNLHPEIILNIPVLSFIIIGSGGLACILGGYLSQIVGIKKTAFISLLLSCVCCIISPWVFTSESESIFIAFLIFWGMVVIADSPLFSTLVAQNATPEIKGTALTIVNCIGFAITIISIQIINHMRGLTDSNNIYVILAIGPILGLIALSKTPTKTI